MKIENWELSKIKPYKNNPRINKDAVKIVARSIKEFGFQQPIVVDDQGVIIVGHTRLLAAKKLKLKTVPVVVASELTENQVRAYRLADNKSGELATWDMEKLQIEIDDLENLSFHMAEFGFSFNTELEQQKNKKEVLIPEIWQVVIECANEEEQKDLFELLTAQGKKCKLLNL